MPIISDSHLCALAAAAYDDPPTWARGDVAVTRTDIDEVSVIAWRGTELSDIGDICRDVDCIPVFRDGYGHVHRGFFEGAMSVAEAIVADVAGRPLLVTGHSLGGAMALVFGAFLVLRGTPPVSVVTFGAPRLGYSTLANVLRDVPGTEYRRGIDPIPDLPPWLLAPRVRARVQIGRPSLEPFADHRVAGYLAALVG
jgi:hypothetical protein